METVRINGQDYTSSLSDTEIAFIGNLSLPTTAQTLSGAIAEHETDISTLNSNLAFTEITSQITFNQAINANWTYIYSNSNMICGQIRFSTPSSAIDNYELAVFPSGARPRASIALSPLIHCWSGAIKGTAVINNRGSLFLPGSDWAKSVDVIITICISK